MAPLRSSLSPLRAACFATLALAAAGCGGERASDSDISYPKVKRKAYHATGAVVDNRGNPINVPGARIVVAVYGQVRLGDRQSASPPVGPDGRYEGKLEEGKFSVEAWINLEYDGLRYKQFLDPLEGVAARTMKNDSSDGIVTHFRWRIQGARPGATDPKSPYSFYGGQVRVAVTPFDEDLGIPDDAVLTMRFAPDGPLIDGSLGTPFEKSCTMGQLKDFELIPDVPMGRWSATGTLLRHGEPMKKLACVGEDGQPKPACAIRFLPSPSAEGFTEPARAVFLEPEFAQ